MKLVTAFGSPDCERIIANKNWQPLINQAEWICEFDNPNTEYLKNCPDIYLAGAFHGRSCIETFVPWTESWGIDNETKTCRLHIALTLAQFAQYRTPDMYQELLFEIYKDGLLFYLQTPGIVEAFPLLRQICTQTLPVAGYVYLISDQQGHYKIGKANNISKRIFQLKTQPPFKLLLIESTWHPQPFELERNLHLRFGKHRINGEWFNFDDATLNQAVEYIQNNSKGWEQLNRIYNQANQVSIAFTDTDRQNLSLAEYVSIDGQRPYIDIDELPAITAPAISTIKEPATSDLWYS